MFKQNSIINLKSINLIDTYMSTKKIALYADKENNRILVNPKGERKSGLDYKICYLPHDPEYWCSSGSGIEDLESFFQTPRGENWIINKIHTFASKYDMEFDYPEKFEEVDMYKVKN